MAKITITFGVLLILLGVIGYESTGAQALIALIPAVFGVVLVILGFLARTPAQKKRMIVMHIAVTVGLLGFLGTVSGIYEYIRMVTGHVVMHPVMVQYQALMSLMMLFYVLLCVRSFIEARRARD